MVDGIVLFFIPGIHYDDAAFMYTVLTPRHLLAHKYYAVKRNFAF